MYLYFLIVYKKVWGRSVQIFGFYGFAKLHLYEMIFSTYLSLGYTLNSAGHSENFDIFGTLSTTLEAI